MLELRDVPAERRADLRDQVVSRVSAARAAARYLDPGETRREVEKMVDDTAGSARLLEVLEAGSGAIVGHVWLGREGEESLVHDVRLDDPDRAGEVVPLLVEVARADGSRKLGAGASPDDPSRTALSTQPGWVARATNMVLDLSAPVADPGAVALRAMTADEFDAFVAVMVDDYAATLVEAGMSPEGAAERSRQQMAELIPAGRDSAGMEFFTAWHGDTAVGRLWLSVGEPMAFVYDVEVREDQRRRGYGAAIMNAAAAWSRDHGHPVLGLNVFAHNPGARALYDGLGYRVTTEYRTLDLADPT